VPSSTQYRRAQLAGTEQRSAVQFEFRALLNQDADAHDVADLRRGP
jgi:hypothetical protein